MSRCDESVRVDFKIFTSIYISDGHLCLFLKIKYAVYFCVLDFFYFLKEKHCRSPPFIQFTKI